MARFIFGFILGAGAIATIIGSIKITAREKITGKTLIEERIGVLAWDMLFKEKKRIDPLGDMVSALVDIKVGF